jgi:hypothetical protein
MASQERLCPIKLLGVTHEKGVALVQDMKAKFEERYKSTRS